MKAIFESVVSRKHPKGIGLGFNYYKSSTEKDPSLRTKHPVLFQKSLSSLLHNPKEVRLDGINPIYFEVELGVLIGKSGKNIPASEYEKYVGGYFLLIDFTLEGEGLLEKDSPWFLRKCMDNFFIVSDFVEKEQIPDPHNVQLLLSLNGEEKQNANTNQMMYTIPETIEYVSKFMTINEGDLILTGTPPGKTSIANQDKLEALLSSTNGDLLSKLDFTINMSK